MRASGRGGELRYKYQLAAVFGDWTLDAHHESRLSWFALTATITEAIEPWCARIPLDLHLQFGDHEWRWYKLSHACIVPAGDSKSKVRQLNAETLRIELKQPPIIIRGSSRNE
jgi:hypothetical protein